MNKSTILRTTFFILLIASFAASKDKTHQPIRRARSLVMKRA